MKKLYAKVRIASIHKKLSTVLIIVLVLITVLFFSQQKKKDAFNKISGKEYRQDLIEALAYIELLASRNNIDKIIATRYFITGNSSHGNGPWQQQHGGNYPFILDHLLKVSKNSISSVRPELLCGQHANMMGILLEKQGYRFRFIRPISTSGSIFMDHVALEVLNPYTNKWEFHDPNYGVHYINVDTGMRLSVEDLAKTDLGTASSSSKKVLPCGLNDDVQEKCVWEHKYMRNGFTPKQLRDAGFLNAFEYQGEFKVVFNRTRTKPFRNVMWNGKTVKLFSVIRDTMILKEGQKPTFQECSLSGCEDFSWKEL